MKPASLVVAAVALTVCVVVATCDDDPFKIEWIENQDTVTLYSLAVPYLNVSSGFDFWSRRALRIEAASSTGAWDMAIDTDGARLVLLPPGALGVLSEARLAPMAGETYEGLDEAPADSTRYVSKDPVPARGGDVFVVRTHEQTGLFGQRCKYYGKFEVLEADVDGGRLTFRFDMNPECDSRKLQPKK